MALSLALHAVRNNLSDTSLNFRIKERVVEIMGPLRGRIM